MDISPIVLLAGLIPPLVWYFPHWLKLRLVAKPKPEEDKELQDLSDWKKYADEARDRKNKEFKEWLQEFKELLQKTCKHRYKDADHWWWQCIDCAHEHPWAYRYDCTCRTQNDYSIGGLSTKVLTYRKFDCPAHGRPRFVAHQWYKEGKLTAAEANLWDTQHKTPYLFRPEFSVYDKSRLKALVETKELTVAPEVVRLGIAGQREPIIKGN